MSDLEELLQREVEIGTFDSTGIFTLSLVEARHKLQQFQLASLEKAVLKLMQACVRLEPEAIWMASTDRGFAIYWADPKEELEAQQFAGDLEAVLLGADSAARDMAIGLTSFLDKEPAQIWWSQWHGSRVVETVNLLGGQSQAQLYPPPGIHQRTFALVITAASQSLVIDRQQVADRTIFSPVLTLWNGRLLCDLSWKPSDFNRLKPPYWADLYFQTTEPLARGLALKPIGACQRQATETPTFTGDFPAAVGHTVQKRFILGDGGRALHLKGRKAQISGWRNLINPGNAVGLPVELTTSLGESIWVVSGQQEIPAVLLCVKHGVLLEPCSLPKLLGGTVVVLACPDLEVDMSQFSPIVNSYSWYVMRDRVLEQAQEVVEQISKNPPSTMQNAANLGGMWALAALTGGALGAVFLPLPGIVGGLVAAVGSFLVVKAVDDDRYQQRIARLRKAAGHRGH